MTDTRTFKFVWLGIFLALVLASSVVKAGPPFITDDPEPVEYQHWELYLASLDFKNNRDWTGTLPHVEINYGVITNVQLHAIMPAAFSSSPGNATHHGYGDTELGIKFRFIQETETVPQVGVFPLLELATGNAANNLGNGGSQALLPVWLQKSCGSWTVYGGGGYGVNSGPGNQDWQFAGVVLQKQVTTNVLIGAEIYHQTALVQGDPANTSFNVGTVIDFSEHQHLLLSAGRSIDGPTKFQCYVAWQFTFDNSLFQFHRPVGPGK
jgi:hypothetical protein